MESLFPVVLVVFVAFAIWAWIHESKKRRLRQEALAKWAHQRGWDYSPGNEHDVEGQFPQFSCFRQGSNRYGYNIVRGALDSHPLCALDYHYETYSTDSKGRRTTHHHHFSALLMDTGLRLQPLAIRPESWFDKVAEFFGFDDIDFESAEFSRAFHVKCRDKRHAFDMIPQATMEFLLESPRFTLELATPYVLVYRSKTFKPMEFDQALALAQGFMARVPKDIRAALAMKSA